MNKAEYSKRSIAEALLQLMETEDYDRITIQQIVDAAGVSRMAFYRNFESKDQILQYHVDRITDEFVLRAGLKEKYDAADTIPYFLEIFRHGICSIYYAWLVSGCKESVEELTDMILQVATLPQSS